MPEDKLKNLKNSDYLMENYEKFLEYHKNSRFLMFDIQKFKSINDTYGHNAGNDCLYFFYEIINKIFSDSIAVRLHGDEFVIITDHSIEEINKRFDIMDYEIKMAVKKKIIPTEIKYNCGAVLFDENFENTKNKADAMMYHAKDNNSRLQDFTKEIWENRQYENNFINELENNLINNKFKYSVANIYNYNEEKTNILDLYTKNEKYQPLFTNNNYNILKKYAKIKTFDILNTQNIFDNILPKIIYQRIIIRINHISLINPKDILKYFSNLKMANELLFDNILISIDINDIEPSNYSPMVFAINMLKQIGVKIILNNISSKNGDYLWEHAEIDYVKFKKDFWKNSIMNIKTKYIIESKTNMYSKMNTRILYDGVEKKEELEHLKSISNERTLFTGQIFGKELKLKKEMEK